MADRQDIDALMVGALYGELTAAERTKLEAHLASHPEDRAAMDGLETARATVRRGMTEMAPAEPPQAVSAILLQEASRRRASTVTATEPAEREGVWDRFVAWFRPLAGHPGLAAAAALILVAGTATALWVRNKGKVTEPTTSTVAREETAAAPRPGFAAADKAAAQHLDGDSAGAAMGSGASPDPTAPLVATLDERNDSKDDSKESAAQQRDTVASAGKGAAGSARGRKPTDANGIMVEGKADVPEVKNLDGDEEQFAESADDHVEDRAKTTTATGAAPPRVAPEPEPAIVDPEVEAWAKVQHQQLVKLVKAGKCPDAGRVGSEIKAKAPEYYAANVANDRDIRQCKQYIEKQAKKKAEKDYKSRSQGNAYDDADAEATE